MNPRKRESKFAFACSTWNNALLGVAAAPARLPLIGLLVSVRREGRGKLSNTIKTIAINTGGGDAPGLNAVIHGAVYAARGIGWDIVGIHEGYDGILEPERYPDGGLMELHRSTVREISHLGGTILGTTNRGNPFRRVVEQPGGTKKEVDFSDEVIRRSEEHTSE